MKRHAVFITMLVATMATFGLVLGMTSVEAAELSGNTPKNTNSDPSGSHVFFLRKNSVQGTSKEVRLAAYYPGNVSNWDSQYIQITPGKENSNQANVCDTNPANNAEANNKYIIVTLTDRLNGGNKKVYYIKQQNVCKEKTGRNDAGVVSDSNVLYARYSLPNKPASKESVTKMYVIDVTIEYHQNTPQDAGGIRFKLTSPTPNIKLGQRGGGNSSFPLIGDWSFRNQSETSIRIPFGACTASDAGPKRVSIYDADNPDYDGNGGFPNNYLRFGVVDVTNGNEVPISFDNSGNIDARRIGNFIAYPAGGASNKQEAWIRINMELQHQYELVIYDLNPRNAIDVAIPAEAIYGDRKICNTNPDIRTTTVTPKATGGTEVESGDSMTFYQTASVVNMPDDITEWGYTERGIRGNPFARKPTQQNYPARNPDNQTPIANEDGCTKRNASNKCIRWDWKCNYSRWPKVFSKADAGDGSGMAWGGLLADKSNRPVCPTAHKYDCVDQAPYWNFNNSGGWCTNQWNCPAPSSKVIYSNNEPNNCNVWKCPYPSDDFIENGGFDAAKARCEVRCNSGAGVKPPNRAATDGDDNNCYLPPKLHFACDWDGPGGTTSPTVIAQVNGSGYCTGLANYSITRSIPDANGNVCATSTSVVYGWEHPRPGLGLNDAGTAAVERTTWNVVTGPASEACGEVGTKPYLKVFNGDVVSGQYLSYDTAAQKCTVNNGDGNIQTWNQDSPSYYGSGTTDAVVAAGNIAGFRSTNTKGAVLSQKGLTFANTEPSAVYGGSFGPTTSACTELEQELKGATAITQNRTSDFPISLTNITGDNTYVVNGDLYINSPTITYVASAATVAQLPRLKMIVLGNIYIAANVTRMDGIYAAVATNGTNGHIYTCAQEDGSGGFKAIDAGNRQAECGEGLVVNGALSARSVKFHRTSGTLRDAGDENVGTSNATEIVNYSPLVWLPRGGGGLPQEPETITGLPPIL